MQESTFIKLFITCMGATMSILFGGVDLIFRVLLLFIALDYITGLMKGFLNKSLSSAIGWKGLMRKVGILIAVIVAHQMDKIAGTQIVRNGVITFFLANEGISLTENLSVMGVPIPKIMLDTLKIWKDKEELKEEDLKDVE